MFVGGNLPTGWYYKPFKCVWERFELASACGWGFAPNKTRHRTGHLPWRKRSDCQMKRTTGVCALSWDWGKSRDCRRFNNGFIRSLRVCLSRTMKIIPCRLEVKQQTYTITMHTSVNLGHEIVVYDICPHNTSIHSLLPQTSIKLTMEIWLVRMLHIHLSCTWKESIQRHIPQ